MMCPNPDCFAVMDSGLKFCRSCGMPLPRAGATQSLRQEASAENDRPDAAAEPPVDSESGVNFPNETHVKQVVRISEDEDDETKPVKPRRSSKHAGGRSSSLLRRLHSAMPLRLVALVLIFGISIGAFGSLLLVRPSSQHAQPPTLGASIMEISSEFSKFNEDVERKLGELDEALKDKELKLGELDQKIAVMQRQLISLQKQIVAAEGVLASLRQETVTTESRLATLRKQTDEEEEKLAALTRQGNTTRGKANERKGGNFGTRVSNRRYNGAERNGRSRGVQVAGRRGKAPTNRSRVSMPPTERASVSRQRNGGGLKNQINAGERRVKELKAQIAVNERRVRELKAQIADGELRVSGLRTQIADGERAVRNLQRQMAGLKNDSDGRGRRATPLTDRRSLRAQAE